jgi:hypothetical protein
MSLVLVGVGGYWKSGATIPVQPRRYSVYRLSCRKELRMWNRVICLTDLSIFEEKEEKKKKTRKCGDQKSNGSALYRPSCLLVFFIP